jgi:multidrug efflux pump
VLEVNPHFRKNPADLQDIYVPTGAGALVPLSTFAHIEKQAAPLTVNHQGQFPAVTISFNLAPTAALGDAVTAINKAKNDIGVPNSIQAGFQGTAAAFEASLTNEPLLILAALVTVYIVLGVFTKATSIQSRSSQRFPPPASAHCSHC